MCGEAMAQGAQAEASNRRKSFNIARTIVQIANLLRPTAPEGFEIRVAGTGSFAVLADQQEVFRILFNLVHNALTIARQQTKATERMSHVTVLVERNETTVSVR